MGSACVLSRGVFIQIVSASLKQWSVWPRAHRDHGVTPESTTLFPGMGRDLRVRDAHFTDGLRPTGDERGNVPPCRDS